MIATMTTQKINYVWLFLISATLFSWWTIEGGSGFSLGIDTSFLSVAITMIASVKVYFVIMYFMEIDAAPMQLKALLIFWLVITVMSIVLINLNPSWVLMFEGG